MTKECYSLDTSFVLRLLTRDPLPLYQRASIFFEQWKKGSPPFNVPDLVLAECYFALQYHYSFSKTDALESLRLFSQHPAIACSSWVCAILKTKGIGRLSPGFVDRLIHAHAVANDSTLVTFEKSAAKLKGVMIL